MDYDTNLDDIRQAVEDYYGSAMFSGFPMAMIELERVKHMSDSEILAEARKLGIL